MSELKVNYRRKSQWAAVRRKQRRAQFLFLGGRVMPLLMLALVVILIWSIAAGSYGTDGNHGADGKHGTDGSYGTLAGEGSAAMVVTASSQIGNKGGEEYWRWYGFSSRVDWCAVFVSWCAEQSGLLKGESMPRFAVCDDGIDWFTERQRWVAGTERKFMPPAGAVIFFDWDQDGRADHVGIVEKCEDGQVYTIEGNSDNICRRQCYPLGSETIAGYGVGQAVSQA